MKNLLLIIEKLTEGGAEKAITILADQLKKNYNVTLVTFENYEKSYKSKVKTIDLKTRKSKNYFVKLYRFIVRIRKIKKIKKELNIQCSISFLPGPNIVNVLTNCGEKKIISVRNMQSKLNKNIFRDIINFISARKTDKIVMVADAVGEDFIKRYKIKKDKTITIRNMIENLKPNKNREYNEEQIITMGRLTRQKGYEGLLRAFVKVVQVHPKAKLVILGRGENEKKLKQMIIELNLENNVIMEGYINEPEKILSKSSIYISNSVFEGISNAILEAMNYGLPIIATDCIGGTREILEPELKGKLIEEKLEGKYGILVPISVKQEKGVNLTKEDEILAETIVDLIENKKKREHYIAKSYERVKDFSPNKIINKWINVIEN